MINLAFILLLTELIDETRKIDVLGYKPSERVRVGTPLFCQSSLD